MPRDSSPHSLLARGLKSLGSGKHTDVPSLEYTAVLPSYRSRLAHAVLSCAACVKDAEGDARGAEAAYESLLTFAKSATKEFSTQVLPIPAVVCVLL